MTILLVCLVAFLLWLAVAFLGWSLCRAAAQPAPKPHPDYSLLED